MVRLLLIPLLFALSCAKVKDQAPKEPEVPEPEGLLLRASVASPRDALARAKAYAEAVQPGSGAAVEEKMIGDALAGMLQSEKLDGIDLGKPLHVLVLDPRKFPKPVILVVGAADPAKLQAAKDVAVEVKDGRAVIGDAAAVKVASAYARAVDKLPAPSAPTLTMRPAKLVTQYKAEIDGLRKNMAALAQQSPAMAKVVDVEIDLFVRLADQSDRLDVILDAVGGEAYFEMALVPRKDTTFAKFNAAQKSGVDTSLLTRLPAVEKPSMLMTGRYELGPARQPILDLVYQLMEAALGQKLDAKQREAMVAWLDLFDGRMAMIASSGEGGMQMLEAFGSSDGAKAAAKSREVLAALFAGPRTFDLMGLKMTLSAKSGVATHDGVSIDEYAVAFDLSTMPEMQQEMMRKMYGERMVVQMAGFDKTVVAAFGSQAAAQMPRLIDAARKGGGKLAPAATAALDASAKRKASIAMFMDYAQMLGSMLGKQGTSTSGIVIDFGFADGAARMRFGVPAVHVKELTALFR